MRVLVFFFIVFYKKSPGKGSSGSAVGNRAGGRREGVGLAWEQTVSAWCRSCQGLAAGWEQSRLLMAVQKVTGTAKRESEG